MKAVARQAEGRRSRFPPFGSERESSEPSCSVIGD